MLSDRNQKVVACLQEFPELKERVGEYKNKIDRILGVGTESKPRVTSPKEEPGP